MAKDDQQGRPPGRLSGHWSRTRLLAFFAILLCSGAVLVMPLVFVGFRDFRPFGFPPHYFYASEGALLLIIILVFWFSGRQRGIDRDFAMAEED